MIYTHTYICSEKDFFNPDMYVFIRYNNIYIYIYMYVCISIYVYMKYDIYTYIYMFRNGFLQPGHNTIAIWLDGCCSFSLSFSFSSLSLCLSLSFSLFLSLFLFLLLSLSLALSLSLSLSLSCASQHTRLAAAQRPCPLMLGYSLGING